MSLTINGNIVCELQIQNFVGLKAVGHFRLQCTVECRAHGFKEHPPILADPTGDLYVKLSTGVFSHLAKLMPEKNYYIKTHETAYDHQLIFIADLDRAQMDSLEELRNGGKIDIELRFHMRAHRQGEVHDLFENLTQHFNQGTWVEILAQMGYKYLKLLELPDWTQANSPTKAETVAFLSTAHRHFLNGDWRESVGACRDALESLAQVTADKGKLPPEAEGLFHNTREKSLESRYAILRHALKIVCHPAKHGDENAVDIKWQRRDAESVLGICLSLVSLAEANT